MREPACYNFELTGNVENRGGAIFGQWTEVSSNAAGTIEGRAASDHIEAAACSRLRPAAA